MRNLADDHAHAVVHPAGRPQLAHAGVDERHAGAAPLPGRAARSVGVGHGNASNSGRQLPRRELGRVEEQRGARTRASRARRRNGSAPPAPPPHAQRVPHLRAGDLAPAQVRREPRGRRRSAGRSRRRRSRRARRRGTRRGARCAAASPGVQAARRPPAQSGRVGSRPQSSTASARGMRRPRSRPGRAADAAARAATRRLCQNGVNTQYGVPWPVRTVHGSKSSVRRRSSAVEPASRSAAFSSASTSRSGPP